jgi:peptidyl-tRNA hydrolase, PTH1 family
VKLIAGLGNPGRTYAKQRHNVGFQVIDLLAQRHDISVEKRSFGALVGKGVIEGEAVLLVKPQTFMNLSGESVQPILGYYRLSMEELIVVHDDLDLDVGSIKIVTGAGAGGHNGVRSIIQRLSGKDFCRVRSGIGRPPKGWDPADYVLTKFSESEKDVAKTLVEQSADVVEMLIKEGINATQQKYH